MEMNTYAVEKLMARRQQEIELAALQSLQWGTVSKNKPVFNLQSIKSMFIRTEQSSINEACCCCC